MNDHCSEPLPAMARINPHRDLLLECDSAGKSMLEFHRRLPAYMPTPLLNLPTVAARLGVGSVHLKDESNRLGLPAFKILGASWAVARALARRFGGDMLPDFELLQPELRGKPILISATDGNHGRAVAHVARTLGLPARIFLPAGAAPARSRALREEGAEVRIVNGDYDDAVARAARFAEKCGGLLVQDTVVDGQSDVPSDIVHGYLTLFLEIDAARTGQPAFDLVLVQIGVGSLAATAVQHYRFRGMAQQPALIGVEPIHAASTLAACDSGRIVRLPQGPRTIMAGLECGTVCELAWPQIRDGFDGFLAVHDERTKMAMRCLHEAGVVSGESGAAGLAGLMELVEGSGGELARHVGLGANSNVLMLSTEGATDPEGYGAAIQKGD